MFMRLFDNVYKTAYIKENKNIAPNSLDPQIFYFPESGANPILLPSVRSQILMGIEEINRVESAFTQTRVFDYILTGPIFNKNASETCDMVIKVQINTTQLDDVLKERILQTIKEINGKLVVGTRHPLIYIPTIRKIEIEKLNGAYRPWNNKWEKLPDFLQESKKSIEHLSDVKTKVKNKQTLTKGLKKIESV
jgi:hypothetical protein